MTTDRSPDSDATDPPPSRWETLLDAVGPADFTGLVSLAIAAVVGAVALGRRLGGLGRRLVGVVRRRP